MNTAFVDLSKTGVTAESISEFPIRAYTLRQTPNKAKDLLLRIEFVKSKLWLTTGHRVKRILSCSVVGRLQIYSPISERGLEDRWGGSMNYYDHCPKC